MCSTRLFPVCLIAFSALAQTPATQDTANRTIAPEPTAAVHTGAAVYTPMTQEDRLRYYFKHMLSAESVLRSAAAAGINQLSNTPSEWGQGAEGYGRRFASSYGEHIVQSTTMYGFGAVLHEDNRYFLSGETSKAARLKYALLSSVMGRHDDGSRHFSFSRVSSYAVAAGVSRLWQPPSTSGAGSFASSFGISVAAEAGFNVAREFFPNILHTRPPVTVSQASAR